MEIGQPSDGQIDLGGLAGWVGRRLFPPPCSMFHVDPSRPCSLLNPQELHHAVKTRESAWFAIKPTQDKTLGVAEAWNMWLKAAGSGGEKGLVGNNSRRILTSESWGQQGDRA